MTGASPSVDGLRKSYGGHEALRGISFEIREGEVFSLLGPNGAGKTTTIEILEGYRARDGGDVSVLGVDPRARARTLARADRRRPAVVGDVRDADRAREPRALRAATTATAPVGRGDRARRARGEADALVRKLSGGQQRRLDFGARARRRPRADLPRRADDRLRPGGAARTRGRRSARCASSARRSS